MATPLLDRRALLQAIRRLPPEEQQDLALEILRSAQRAVRQEPHMAPDSRRLAGLLATGDAPPTDHEIAEWLDEHRNAKYGE